MWKYITIGAIAIVLLLATGYYFSKSNRSNAPEPTPGPVVQVPILNTFSTSTYSIKYPPEFREDATYAYQGVPNKPIAGVKFVIPGEMATGTNLSANDTGVSVEQLPRAKNCSADIYIYQNVRASEVTIGGKVFSVASTSGAAAGNLYEEFVYALPGSSPCTAVRYFIHSGNIGNYTPGAVREFDRAALIAEFDKIRDSLVVNPSTTTSQ